MCYKSPHILTTGYLLMDYIDKQDSKMLSTSWDALRHDKHRKKNLFRDMSRIILSLGRIPLPRIGSFTLDHDGVVGLTNRPLTLRHHALENEGIPTNIDRTFTYDAVEPYVSDLLSYHDNRLLHQPNAVLDEADGRVQMAALSIMRSVSHRFINRHFRHGPFLLTLTDFQQSNIFVDDDWHIRYVVDLEWACSLPIEMQHPPYWLTDRGVDQLYGADLDAFNDMHEEFMNAFGIEERLLISSEEHTLPLRTQTMREGLKRGTFWFVHALDSTKGLFNLVDRHIGPIFSKTSPGISEEIASILSPYWRADAMNVISNKVKDMEQYPVQLQHAYVSATKDQKDRLSLQSPV